MRNNISVTCVAAAKKSPPQAYLTIALATALTAPIPDGSAYASAAILLSCAKESIVHQFPPTGRPYTILLYIEPNQVTENTEFLFDMRRIEGAVNISISAESISFDIIPIKGGVITETASTNDYAPDNYFLYDKALAIAASLAEKITFKYDRRSHDYTRNIYGVRDKTAAQGSAKSTVESGSCHEPSWKEAPPI